MRRFVVFGQKATASGDFLFDDLPGTSGRLDVLLRCVRAALLYSHGIRRDVTVYLVLGGGPRAPRVLRIDPRAQFLRPDERSLAILANKVLTPEERASDTSFVEVRPGVSILSGGLAAVLADMRGAPLYVLEENALDLRDDVSLGGPEDAFFVGDHLGFDPHTRAALAEAGGRAISVGPLSLHAEDAITIVSNELDRRGAPRAAWATPGRGTTARRAP